MQIDFWHALVIAMTDKSKFISLKSLNCIHRDKHGTYDYFIKRDRNQVYNIGN